MNKKTALIIILAVSLATHFAFFGRPNETVFDEVHFGKFISAYYTHQYYFDIHPPLGKLIIAGFGKLFDFQPDFSFAQIGEQFPDNKYLALRFLPVLAGALLPLVIFFLLLELKYSSLAAFYGAFFVAIENALITQTHYILLDAFLLLFGFSSLLFYFKYRNAKPSSEISGNSKRFAHPEILLLGMAILGSLAASVKWTGLGFLAIGFIWEALSIIKNRDWDIKKMGQTIIFFGAIPLAIYFSIFTLHFSLLTKKGTGDAFMTPGFQKTLEGNPYSSDEDLATPNLLGKFIELNKEMYVSNQNLTATHPYGSKWYTWPFMIRPIYYWVHNDGKIYLLGNPVIWWASTVAVLYLILNVFYSFFRKSKDYNLKPIVYFLLGGYILNLLPFIGIKRVMFLYHYLTALVFAILIMVYLIDKNENRKKYFIALAIVGTIAFIYFAPLSYGLNLSPESSNARAWLPSWK